MNAGGGGRDGWLQRQRTTSLIIAATAVAALTGAAIYLLLKLERSRALVSQTRAWDALRLAVLNRDTAAAARALSELHGTSAAAPLCAPELVIASKLGDDEMVKLLLAAHVSVDSRDERGATGLLAAAAVGRTGVVGALLEARADPTARDDSGLTAAYYAAAGGYIDVLRLLARSASPALSVLDATDSKLNRPIFVAVDKNQLEVVMWLCGCGVDVSSPMKNGVTLLMVAAQRNRLGICRCLIAAGANVSYVDAGTGRSPLNIAAGSGAIESVALLLASGAGTNGEGRNDEPPMVCAARKGHCGVLEALAAAGGDVNCVLPDGRPLLMAACQGFPKAVDGERSVVYSSMRACVPCTYAMISRHICYATCTRTIVVLTGPAAPETVGGRAAAPRLIIRPEVVGTLLQLGADPDLPSTGLSAAAAAACSTARDVIVSSGDKALLAALLNRDQARVAEPEPRSP